VELTKEMLSFEEGFGLAFDISQFKKKLWSLAFGLWSLAFGLCSPK
jgi:hypothetical protein